MENNKLSTKIYKINFKNLIDNATNRKFWEQKWKIFECDGYKVEFYLQSISVQDNKLIFTIKSIDSKNDYSYSTCLIIPLQEDHYNEDALLKELAGKVDSCLKYCTMREVKNTYTYKEIEDKQEDLINELRKFAENFLNENNVYNAVIRDVYIENYIENNVRDLLIDYLYEAIEKANIHCRATWFTYMGYPEKAEAVIVRGGKMEKIKEILEESKRIASLIEQDKMDEFINCLKDL